MVGRSSRSFVRSDQKKVMTSPPQRQVSRSCHQRIVFFTEHFFG
jgi:hypothetical protein